MRPLLQTFVFPVRLNLPYDRLADPPAPMTAARHACAWPAVTVDSLRQLAADRAVESPAVLAAAFLTLLHRYCVQDDIAVWAVVSQTNQVHAGMTRGHFADDPTFHAIVSQVSVDLTATSRHASAAGAIPPSEAISTGIHGTPRGIQAAFLYHAIAPGGANEGSAGPAIIDDAELALVVQDSGHTTEVELVYRPELFSPAMMESLAESLAAILESAVNRPMSPYPVSAC